MSPWAGTGDPASALALACERFGDGLAGQPANTVTSLAFVLAGAAVLAARRGPVRDRWVFGLLVAAVGVGSVVQHGPHPPWQAYAHDLPLAALLGFVAAGAAADLTGGALAARPAPVVGGPAGLVGGPAVLVAGLVAVAMLPVVAAGPGASTAAQGLLAAAAIGLCLLRARQHPELRRPLLGALVLLAAGALAGTLTDRTALCRPDSLWQGHAAWHLLAAAALWSASRAILVVRGPDRGQQHMATS